MTYVPYTMDDVLAAPRNGLTVASTFSGGGGSSTGYRLAGYRVVYANEFVEAARDTYLANYPGTVVDQRDIREVSGADVLAAAGVSCVDVLDGSPPCCSFSLAGSGSEGWGKVRRYSDTAQRTDDLFFEWLRLLGEIRPRGFICENVPALAQGRNKGYFREIVRQMRALGYEVSARVVCAEWLGVPQARHRLIFVGVRRGEGSPAFPEPDRSPCVLGDALAGCDPDSAEAAWLERESDRYAVGRMARSIPTGSSRVEYARDYVPGGYFQLTRASMARPCPTLTASMGQLGIAATYHPTRHRKFTVEEARRIMSLPDDYRLTGTYEQQMERCGRMVPPRMMERVARALAGVLLGEAAHGA